MLGCPLPGCSMRTGGNCFLYGVRTRGSRAIGLHLKTQRTTGNNSGKRNMQIRHVQLSPYVKHLHLPVHALVHPHLANSQQLSTIGEVESRRLPTRMGSTFVDVASMPVPTLIQLHKKHVWHALLVLFEWVGSSHIVFALWQRDQAWPRSHL